MTLQPGTGLDRKVAAREGIDPADWGTALRVLTEMADNLGRGDPALVQ